LATLEIIQRRSAAGTNQSQRATLRSLGLRGIGSAVERTDGPAVQGMIRTVSHLIEVHAGGEPRPAAPKRSDG
jgi:large subunit ribosomal protein L30